MGKLFREFLFLKRGERNSLIAVGFLVAGSLIFRLAVSYRPGPDYVASEDFLNQVAQLQRELKTDMARSDQEPARINVSKPSLNLSFFDPNSVTTAELREMGFTGRVVSNMMRYREAGGIFKTPGDIGKIYGMDSVTFRAIVQYVIIRSDPGDQQVVKPDERFERHKAPTIIELNSADSVGLINIPGIGPVFATRIIKYRTLLGGFYDMGQLWEVYGMDSMRFLSLSESVLIDTVLIEGLKINESSFSELLRHPYLTRKEVADIINYRDYAGEINGIKELQANRILDSMAVEKIRPYLIKNFNSF